YKNYRLPVDHDAYKNELITMVIHRQPCVNANAFTVDILTLVSMFGAAPAQPQPETASQPMPKPQPLTLETAPDDLKRYLLRSLVPAELSDVQAVAQTYGYQVQFRDVGLGQYRIDLGDAPIRRKKR